MNTDIARVKRNVAKLIDQGAPETDIDAYIAGEGVTLAQLRGEGKAGPSALETAGDMVKGLGSGAVRGTAQMLGIGGDIAKGGMAASDMLAQSGLPVGTREQMTEALPGFLRKYHDKPNPIVGSAEIMNAVDEATGVPVAGFKPQTPAGQAMQRAGEFAPNMIAPGSLPMRIMGGVVGPAIGSEIAGQLAQGGKYEGAARIAGALGGGFAGSGIVAGANRTGSRIPGASAEASKVLERNVGYGAEANLAELGPQAFLYEGTEAAKGIAQGIASRPSPAMDRLVGALKGRQAGANRRLEGDLTQTLGPAHVPSVVEGALKGQREAVAKDYPAALRFGQRVEVKPILKALDAEIDLEAGGPKKTLLEIKGYLFNQKPKKDAAGRPVKGPDGKTVMESVLKTNPAEILNVRQAVDDLIQRIDTPNTKRVATIFRKKIDDALARAAPDVKRVDAKFAELAGQSEALTRGGQVLNIGKESIRPIELSAEMAGMSPAQKDMLRVGARAELDRLVGTRANDVTALKLLVQSEGDWNRTKLSKLFGASEAEKILKSIDREAAFQDTYRRLYENSQTAQRRAGQEAVAEATKARAPTAHDLTVLGAAMAPMQKGYRALADALAGKRRLAADEEIAGALSTQGDARDRLLKAIRDAQKSRSKSKLKREAELMRAILNANAAEGVE